jgi:hypothetical protein
MCNHSTVIGMRTADGTEPSYVMSYNFIFTYMHETGLLGVSKLGAPSGEFTYKAQLKISSRLWERRGFEPRFSWDNLFIDFSSLW